MNVVTSRSAVLKSPVAAADAAFRRPARRSKTLA
jgi:hypothetical protein